LNIPHITSPIRRKQTSFDITVKAAMRPIGYARNVSVLHRIEMNIIDMAFKIRVIANSVLPIPTPPNAFFSFFATLLVDRACAGSRPREKPLLIKLQRDEKSASHPAAPKEREGGQAKHRSRSSRMDGVAESSDRLAAGDQFDPPAGCWAVQQERP
jgi:hypothetical protein